MTHTSVLLAFAALVATISPALAQQPEQKSTPQSNIITLNGCVTSDPAQHNGYTLTEANDPTVYASPARTCASTSGSASKSPVSCRSGW